MGSKCEEGVLSALAFSIYRDIEQYISEHQDEFNEWLKSQESSDQKDLK